MSEIYRTGISNAYWCSTTTDGVAFAPAKIPFKNETDPEEVSWVDELLEGGLRLPDKNQRPLFVLLAGPPGSGKTTFAMELCYRLARNDNNVNPERLFTLYISTDQPGDRLIENTQSFGYQGVDAPDPTLVDFTPDPELAQKFGPGKVAVWGRDRIQKEADNARRQGDRETIASIVDAALTSLTSLFFNQVRANVESEPWIRRLWPDFNPAREENLQIQRYSPDILVVDSLNVIVPDLRAEFFERFQFALSSACRMIIFVLDAASEHAQHEIWEYASDVVIRLDATSLNGYYVRTIQIMKARYQSHVWGKHQLKIYRKPELPLPNNPIHEELMRRNHPYRNDGGVFVFPSIHFYLSKYKRRGLTGKQTFADTWPKLEGVLDEGFPEGRCTAFIGERGGHKSHFAYVHLLHRIINRQKEGRGREDDPREEAALVISLRDDENMTYSTMDKIRRTEFPDAKVPLSDLRRSDKLEILYFHPGYITPEEFFHRMYISLHRLKQGNKRKVTVMFNSVDQLSSRFPLCAKQEIFIPGIIETLSGEGITSIFIAVDEPGQPAEQYGLLPMADLILSFYPYRFSCQSYFKHLDAARELTHMTDKYRERIDQWLKEFVTSSPDTIPEVAAIVLQVVRFAGGQKAGAKGILELVHDTELGLYKSEGLHFTRLDAKYDQGVRMFTGRETG